MAPAALDGHVPWENFVKFVRQLSHDLRNQLNAAELQSALIAELTNDAELKSEIRRLRELVSQLGVTLQSLSASVAEPRPNKSAQITLSRAAGLRPTPCLDLIPAQTQ